MVHSELLIALLVIFVILIHFRKDKRKRKIVHKSSISFWGFKYTYSVSESIIEEKLLPNSDILLYTGSGIMFASGLPILAGFGAGGIVAGSIAAGLQVGIGNMAAGSIFTTMTSLGMEGLFLTGAWGGGAVASAGALKKILD
jgi:hypothetical protein